MIWIKLTHASGSTYLNLEQIYRYDAISSTDLNIYDVSSTTPTTYSFSTDLDLTQSLAKLKSVLKVIDLDQLATQG